MDDSPAVRRHRSLAPARSGEPICALASDPTTSSAAALLPWLAFRVMHQVLSWHGVPLPASSRRGLAGRKRSFPLAASPGSAHGIFFTPFAGLLPPKADAHLCESGPTCPFHRDPSARFIFVGLAPPCFRLAKANRGLTATWTSGINLPAIRAPRRPFARANYNRSGADPAMGFASCRVVDAHSRTLAGSTPRGSSASGSSLTAISTRRRFACVRSPRRMLSRSIAARGQFCCLYSAGAPNPLMGLGDSFPDDCASASCRRSALIRSRLAIASSRGKPLRSPALQRVEGAAALRFRTRSSLARKRSLSEVLHRP